ncbi:uncharacterized protein LOC128386530 [Panonychus citri]|uniref:uncharacterized protein LOC128386530 n=1 Tax=Panonychus citri TaxID=50023 RepID=UPI00230816D7|nr:uncharacterized protein LOC128386530 [Panonychus citri]
MDSEEFFSHSLDSLLNRHGFEKVSIDIYPNRFIACYNYIHRDRLGNQMASSLIEIIGVSVGELLACYGNILKSHFDTPIEPIRIKLRMRGSLDKILNQFEHHFIYRLKDALSLRITDLPVDVLYHLLEYLSVQDIMNLLKVNQSWHRLLDDEYIWRKMYQSTYGEYPEVEEYRSDGTAICNWKNLVLSEYIKRKKMDAELKFTQELARRSLPAPTMFLALPPAPNIHPPALGYHAIPLPGPIGPPVLWTPRIRRPMWHDN